MAWFIVCDNDKKSVLVIGQQDQHWILHKHELHGVHKKYFGRTSSLSGWHNQSRAEDNLRRIKRIQKEHGFYKNPRLIKIATIKYGDNVGDIITQNLKALGEKESPKKTSEEGQWIARPIRFDGG